MNNFDNLIEMAAEVSTHIGRSLAINPGAEERSWERFCSDIALRFKEGDYTRETQAELVAEFEALLPEVPPWIG